MEKFTTVTGVAAPLRMINVDTDRIIPKQFLTTIKRTGLGKFLFNDLRYDPEGSEVEDFVLNQSAYRDAQILIAGRNFGCGSSREHAPWALLDFGISCVIASSFADIFYNNCFKNGVLPAVLPAQEIDQLFRETAGQDGYSLTVNLEEQTILTPTGQSFRFEVGELLKYRLINGLDDIDLTLQHREKIQQHEEMTRSSYPWLIEDIA